MSDISAETRRDAGTHGRALRIDILTALLLLLLVAVATITFYNFSTNSKALHGLSDDLLRRVAGAAIERTSDYLLPPARLACVGAEMAGTEPFDVGTDERFAQFSVAAVRTYPQIAKFQFADADGDFVLARRFPDGTTGVKRIDRTTGEPVATWAVLEPDGRERSREPQADAYDARTRPWYQGALSTKDLFWTDVFVSSFDRTLGVSATCPIRSPDGNVRGVVAVDIEISALAGFLDTLRIGQDGYAFLAHGQGSLIAIAGPGELPKPDPRGLAYLDHAKAPALAQSWRRFLEDGAGRYHGGDGDGAWLAAFERVPPGLGRDWVIGVVTPAGELVGAPAAARTVSLAVSLVVMLVAVLLAMRVSRSISRPIVALTEEMRRIMALELDGDVPVRSNIREIREMTRAVQATKRGLSAFRKYVPAGLVRQLVQAGVEAKLGGARRELTVMFTDIAGFTSLCEGLPADRLMPLLSDYLDELTRVIQLQGGTIDKYIGDAIMAFWNAPAVQEDHPAMACRAALACQRRLDELQTSWLAAGRPLMPTRIGVNTGEAVVGNVGSSDRMNYTALGDSVNIASRTEGLNKLYGTRVVVAEPTAVRVRDRFLLRPLDVVAVKGRHGGVGMYELLAERTDADPPELARLAKMSQDAFDHYRARRFDEARTLHLEIRRERPQDAVSAAFLERIAELERRPPGPEWDGVVHMQVK